MKTKEITIDITHIPAIPENEYNPTVIVQEIAYNKKALWAEADTEADAIADFLRKAVSEYEVAVILKILKGVE